MSQHARCSVATGVVVYFCDPKSPWQRGSNENANGLLRQYLPRTTNMQALTQTNSTPSPPNSPYSAPLSAAGGLRPLRWRLINGTLPLGLGPGFDGVVAGTPTKAGTYRFAVGVTDAFGHAALAQILLTVRPPSSLRIESVAMRDVHHPRGAGRKLGRARRREQAAGHH